MLQDAKDGKIDLIITKEITRFARNVLDSIRYTRELLECGYRNYKGGRIDSHVIANIILNPKYKGYYAEEGSNVRYRLNQRSAESCRRRAAALGLAYSGANSNCKNKEKSVAFILP